jgi:hypothetical protein
MEKLSNVNEIFMYLSTPLWCCGQELLAADSEVSGAIPGFGTVTTQHHEDN